MRFSVWGNSGPFHTEKLLSQEAFTPPAVVVPHASDLLGSHRDTLATALRDQHDAASTLRTHLREARAFGAWLPGQSYPLHDGSERWRERDLHRRASSSGRLHKRRRQRLTAAIHRLLEHLRCAGVVAPRPVERRPETEVQQWRAPYGAPLDHGHGLAPSTRRTYLFVATRLRETRRHQGGMTGSAVTADSSIACVQADAAPRKGFGPHGTATAVRSFRRFLGIQHRRPAGLDRAIPTVRRWSHAGLPQHLRDPDSSQMRQGWADGTARGPRNSAILLRLSRLGRRAKEVANRQLHDVDWGHGRLLIRARKTPAERLLPLAQDVGEARLASLRTGRPAPSSRPLCLAHPAPDHPLHTAAAMTKLVKRLLATAGMARQSSGAHLFRPTVATPLVNRGARFTDIADVLGQHTLQTTGL